MTEWEKDCLMWWGRVLTGELGHWCHDWDGLAIDETCMEIDGCLCDKEAIRRVNDTSVAPTTATMSEKG